MSDMISAIQGNLASVAAAMAAIPQEISDAAASGDFSRVLSGIQANLAVAAPPPAGGTNAGGLVGLSSLITPTGSQPMASQVGGDDVVSAAARYLDTPYVWGGATPSGFDCSGLVQYVYGQLGIALPRTSQEQADVGTAVDSIADAEPGDLLFYPGSDGTPAAPGHVGIYVGNGQMIDAPQTGESVQVQEAGTPVAIRRVLPDPDVTTPLSVGAAASTNTSIPAALQPLFESATTRFALPAGLLPAVASVESNFQSNATSGAGAEGIMQIMPNTAKGLGVDPCDPAQAINGAATLLSSYLNQYGSIPLALAAYNAGPGAVAQYGGVPPFQETQSYVHDVMARMGALQ